MTSLMFLTSLFVALTHFVIGLLVLVKNPHAAVNRLFGGFAAVMSSWTLANYFTDHSNFPLLFNSITFVSAGLAALFLLLFSIYLTSHNSKLLKPIVGRLTLIGLVISGSGATPLVVNGGKDIHGVLNVQFGLFAPVYFGYLLITFLAAMIILIRAHNRSLGAEKIRIRFVLVSIFSGLVFVVLSNVLIPLVFDNFNFVTIGPLAAIILDAGIAYSIVRHRLFNIRPVVARGLTYILVLITMGGGYTVGFFGASVLFFPGDTGTIAQNVVSTIFALIIAFTFQPLRRSFERLTDKLFYRDRYDSQEVLNNFSGILVSELNLDRILKRTITDICQELHIQFGQIVVFDHDRVYRIEHHGPLPKRLMIAPELRRLNHPLMVADGLQEGASKDLLDEHGIRVSLMLRTREQFVGYLLLGDKLSGDIYSKQDIEVVEIIAKQLAVAILNAKAYVEIQEFNQTLQDRVDHATGRLRVANRHLRELDRVKDEFISMASHQLRTPLTTTKGYLSMLMEGDAGKLTKMQHEFAGFAYDGSERMVQLISDLLDVSRLSAGRFIIQAKPTDITAVMRDEVRRLQHHADVKGIELNLVVPKEALPLVMLDDNKTRQVIMNYIDNAIYYTKAGQVKVTLSIKAGMIHLEVRDSGIGVPEIAKKHLFTKFFRADNAQDVRPDGTGLGLFLAKQVIEEQGGTIVFSSTEGKGSTFGFDLPMVAAPQTVTKVSKSLV